MYVCMYVCMKYLPSLPAKASAAGLDGPVDCTFVAVGEVTALSQSTQTKIATIPRARWLHFVLNVCMYVRVGFFIRCNTDMAKA